jgi:DNA adenine methylase
MDSMLNYIGGKSLSAKKIVELMPEHTCYVETNFGSGWVFFAKPISKVEIINDINKELINFWRVIQRQHNEFIERGRYEMYSRELFTEYYTEFMSGKHFQLTNLERAFRFFCLIKESYASKFGSSWGFGSKRNSGNSFFNEFKIIDEIAERLKHVQIDNKDFQLVIEDYDRDYVWFFIDPPYIKTNVNVQYFKSTRNSTLGFTLHDHQRLYNTLSKIKGKFLLTIDDCIFVRERYCEGTQGSKGFYWIENTVAYSLMDKNNRHHATELIITNYDTNEVIKQNKLKKKNKDQIELVENIKSLADY